MEDAMKQKSIYAVRWKVELMGHLPDDGNIVTVDGIGFDLYVIPLKTARYLVRLHNAALKAKDQKAIDADREFYATHCKAKE
jgi:hypothetical protein